MTIRHPDTIPGLAPDCRRVLRDAYQRIQAARNAQPSESRDLNTPRWGFGGTRCVGIGESQQEYEERLADEHAEQSRRIAAAVTHYREVAEMWSVDVG